MTLEPVTIGKSAFPEKAGDGTPTALLEAKSMSQYTPTEHSSDAECPTCGDSFESERGVKSHHKQVHGESIAGVTVQCSNCGSEKSVFPKIAEDHDRHFCSTACKAEWQSENVSGENHPSWEGGLQTVTCDNCGDEKDVKPHVADRERQFCDQGCWGEWASDNLSGSNAHAWEGGLIEVECDVCSKRKRVKPHQAEEYTAHFCESCRSEWARERFSGDGNPRWRGGSDLYHGVKAVLPDRAWSDVAEEVRSRDEVCQMCGESSDTAELDVHHIIPVLAGGLNRPELLMALCRSCHMKAEAYTRDLPGMEPVLAEEVV